MDTLQWILTICLGLGLAASTGFNVTLPLLTLAVLAHFHVAGVHLRGDFAWLTSDIALISLSLAAVVEFLADKIPGIDHGVHAISMFAGPVAGAITAASVQTHADPAVAILLGIVLGGTTSLGITGAVSSLRLGSSAATFGLANPILSFLEDCASVFLICLALFVPLLVPIVVALLVLAIWNAVKAIKRKVSPAKTATT
jgi:hypothetical protein